MERVAVAQSWSSLVNAFGFDGAMERDSGLSKRHRRKAYAILFIYRP